MSRISFTRARAISQVHHLFVASNVHQACKRPSHLGPAGLASSTMAEVLTANPNTDAIKGLQPEPLWKYFADLTQIPRPSKHEEKVLAYLREFAATRNLEIVSDAVGNVVIKRPGSGGGEAAPTVVIQGHIDMVCEKNSDTVHDFFSDPLKLIRQDDWLKADGTTLGADNGIGVATALALLDMPTTAKLPPLECLFTVDEETGLTGAFNIEPTLLKGRTMLNLDTEDWGEIFIGCAGGGENKISLTAAHEALPAGYAAHTLKVSGLMGGHSGLNINEDRGNAVIMAAQMVKAIIEKVPEARLVDLNGGDKRNAIPREAVATLAVPTASQVAVSSIVSAISADLHAQYGLLETGLAIAVSPAPTTPSQCIAPADSSRLTAMLTTLPHGALKLSHAMRGLVETSNNLASVHQSQEGATSTFKVVTSSRSSIMSALEAVREKVDTISKLCGAISNKNTAYPGWNPDPTSPVLQVTKQVYADMLGSEPKVGAIHAGLECGILGEKFPGMDMVSFGPTIRGAHSPDEKVQISTVPPFWALTLRILEKLADKR